MSQLAGSIPGSADQTGLQDNVGSVAEGKLIGIPIGMPAPIGEPLNSTPLAAIEDLVVGLAGDTELATESRHRLADEAQTGFRQ